MITGLSLEELSPEKEKIGEVEIKEETVEKTVKETVEKQSKKLPLHPKYVNKQQEGAFLWIPQREI